MAEKGGQKSDGIVSGNCAGKYEDKSKPPVPLTLVTNLNPTERHLKCDYDTVICHRCQKDGVECNRVRNRIRFQKNAKRGAAKAFSEDQPWLNTNGDLQYVDQTDLMVATHGETTETTSEAVQPSYTPVSLHHSLNAASPSITRFSDWQSQSSNVLTVAENSVAGQPVQLLGTEIKQGTHDLFPSHNRAVLLRYFIQELSLWFDICDHERHFGHVVPQRARFSQTLLNAICTASSRHLVRLPKCRNQDGVIQWDGNLLPYLTQDTALEYHNECIRDLLKFSLDPDQIQNVDLLAASIILRTDEEMNDSDEDGKTHRDVFLRVTEVFMDAQTPSTAAIPHSSPQQFHALNLDSSVMSQTYSPDIDFQSQNETSHPYHADAGGTHQPLETFRAEGLRQACFWIALRQELHASFMEQRPFAMDLSKFDAFRNYSPASDAVWADRVIIFHATVIEFCYAERTDTDNDHSRWYELTREARKLEALLPNSFQPIHSNTPSLGESSVFPEIWYLNNSHVTAAAYVELTRILLASFDPTRPKFGPGFMASQRKVMQTSKSACLKLCGMALSNRQAPPIHLNACAALKLCGEYFEDEIQRQAIVWFLKRTEEDLAYPTSELIEKLEEAWLQG